MRLLIVDDSVVFRSQIKAVAEQIPEITEIVSVANGRLALQRLESTPFDLMTLDLEMPEMNGIETLKALKKLPQRPAVIVFSATTTQGAESTLQAIELGAIDFSPKPSSVQNIEEAHKTIKQDLLPKITSLCAKLQRTRAVKATTVAAPAPTPITDAIPLAFEPSRNWVKVNLDFFRPEAIAIGSSTGGPAALKAVLRSLHAPLSAPIFIAQHMPPIFTKSLADNIAAQLKMEVAEGQNLEPVKPGKIYVAPGDYHMTVKNFGDKIVINLDQKEKRNAVRPAVDPLFESVAEVYGPRLLGIILTGMGQDGLLGCKAIKDKRGAVIIQDEASSAVWGMPGAVFKHNAYDRVCTLEEIEQAIVQQIGRAA